MNMHLYFCPELKYVWISNNLIFINPKEN